jgi:ATP-dependent DNA helicase RecG
MPATNIARERLATLASTTDGFIIAEKDLELRGPGEVFGTEQSGMPHFKFANLVSDQPILKLARQDAFEIITQDPELTNPDHKLLKNIYFRQFAEKEKLILY